MMAVRSIVGMMATDVAVASSRAWASIGKMPTGVDWRDRYRSSGVDFATDLVSTIEILINYAEFTDFRPE